MTNHPGLFWFVELALATKFDPCTIVLRYTVPTHLFSCPPQHRFKNRRWQGVDVIGGGDYLQARET